MLITICYSNIFLWNESNGLQEWKLKVFRALMNMGANEDLCAYSAELFALLMNVSQK